MRNRFGTTVLMLIALQAASLIILSAAIITGWQLLPASKLFFTVVSVGVMTAATIHICRQAPRATRFPGRNWLIAAGTLGILNALMMAGHSIAMQYADAIMYDVCALANGVCCFVLIKNTGGGTFLRWCAGASLGIFVALTALMLALSVFIGSARFDVVSAFDSPDGRYTAEIIDADDKMTGAQVRVRKNKVAGVGINWLLDITKLLTDASGDMEPEYYDVVWEDGHTLRINNWKGEFR